MNKTLALAGLLCLTLASVQQAALAQDWFGRYDGNHDNRWSYDEFAHAHHNWARHHRSEVIMNDVDLHNQFNSWDPDRRGYIVRENVATFHNW